LFSLERAMINIPERRGNSELAPRRRNASWEA
jgi:hypothetical protein